MAPVGPPEGRIREAKQGDRDAVVALWTDLARHHEALDPVYALRPDAAAEIRKLVTAQLRDPDAVTFLWETTGLETTNPEMTNRETASPQQAASYPESTGIHGLCIVRIDRAPPIHWEIERAEITDLIVAVEFRRRGIAGALLDQALAWVEQNGVERVEVRVAAGNVEGQAFWRARGFGSWMDVLQLHL
jgi:GNAT superfamily N-acetyltransferase